MATEIPVIRALQQLDDVDLTDLAEGQSKAIIVTKTGGVITADPQSVISAALLGASPGVALLDAGGQVLDGDGEPVEGREQVADLGSVSGSVPLALTAKAAIATVTLTGDTTVVLSGQQPGSRVTLLPVQNSPGGHSFAVSDGGPALPLAISQGVGQPSWVSIVFGPDGTVGDVSVAGLTAGPTGLTGLDGPAGPTGPPDEAGFATYKRLCERGGQFNAITASTQVLLPDLVGTSAGSASARAAFYWDPADYLAETRTTKMRVRALALVNATAPAATFTLGLYPITGTITGSTGQVAAPLGTVVTGSTVALTAPAAGALVQAVTADFAAPAAGFYALAAVVSANMPAASSLVLRGQVSYRQVP